MDKTFYLKKAKKYLKAMEGKSDNEVLVYSHIIRSLLRELEQCLEQEERCKKGMQKFYTNANLTNNDYISLRSSLGD